MLTIINNVLEKTHSKFGTLATAIFDSANYRAQEGLLGYINEISKHQASKYASEDTYVHNSVYYDINLDEQVLSDALQDKGYSPVSMLKEDLYEAFMYEVEQGGQAKQDAYNFIESLIKLSANNYVSFNTQQSTPAPLSNGNYGKEVGDFSGTINFVVKVLDLVKNNPQEIDQVLSSFSYSYNKSTVITYAEYAKYMMPYLKKDRIFHDNESIKPIADTKYLIIHADRDPLVPFYMANELYTDIVQKREHSEVYFIKSVSSADHGYVFYNSYHVNNKVIDFLKKSFELGAVRKVMYGAYSGTVFWEKQY